MGKASILQGGTADYIEVFKICVICKICGKVLVLLLVLL